MATEQTWEAVKVAEDASEQCFLLHAPSLSRPRSRPLKGGTRGGRCGLLPCPAPSQTPAPVPRPPEPQAVSPSKAPSASSLAALCVCCCLCRTAAPLPAFRGDGSSFWGGVHLPTPDTCHHTGPVKAAGGPPYLPPAFGD